MTNTAQQRSYKRSESIVFLKTKEAFGGLSNMAGGYPLSINGLHIPSSEALYQACRFPHLPDVQRLIIGQNSPMTAKMVGKPYREQSRADWNAVRVSIMRWCLRVKLAHHWERFGELLLSTQNLPIVEQSRRDPFWGAIPADKETLIGVNALGRLLMELRGLLRDPNSRQLQVVSPLQLADFYLLEQPIGIINPFNHRLGEATTEPYNLKFDTSAQTENGVKDNETVQSALFQSTLDALLNEPFLPDDGSSIARPLITIPDYLLTADDLDIEELSVENGTAYPRRLIEVDLPIKRISAHARREKSIRHGHISTLHIWWARRPLAACRAVICASLWPDPADELCPPMFRRVTAHVLAEFAELVRKDRELAELCSPESFKRWQRTNAHTLRANDPACWPELRYALLDFIADFANWDASTVPAYLETSRALTQAAHESLGGTPGTRPLVVDPFAGGGAIPLEALRVGADAFASDLNPIAVLLNKVVLEYIPRYGQHLADEVRKWGQWVKEEAEKELAEIYPKDPDGAIPVAYLWARTIICEGPGCGAEVPLIRSLLLAKKGDLSVALRLVPVPQQKRVHVEIIEKAKAKEVGEGTVRRGSATCPCCGFTTPVAGVRMQLKKMMGGADTSRLMAVVLRSDTEKTYRPANNNDLKMIKSITESISREKLLPFIDLPLMSGVFNVPIYGINRWDLLFSPRQLLVAKLLSDKIEEAMQDLQSSSSDKELALVIKVLLLLSRDKYLDFRSTLCRWISTGEKIGSTFGRQALGMIFDWAEGTAFGDMSGSWERSIEYVAEFLTNEAKSNNLPGIVQQAAAQSHPLPDDSVDAFISDPPYYNAVPYADLSDFFYIWLRRGLQNDFPALFSESVAPKADELCEMRGWDPIRYPHKDASFYEAGMTTALSEGRRLCNPSGIGVLVFAHKSTTGWEKMLSAMIEAGWIVTGSWPIDTERSGRLRAMDSAALASSIHLVCRPREKLDGTLATHIGDWRDVLRELPQRIHEWMPRLTAEGVVGADAIFACLGPALEVFSRYSKVEKASGEEVKLGEYLEHVWAAVSREALSLLFKDADASGLEPDARLTAMWLWTLTGGASNTNSTSSEIEDVADDSEDEGGAKKGGNKGGYNLEFDAARKIAQGLGAHLERLQHVVEVKGETARLLSVGERTRFLFGKDEAMSPGSRRPKKSSQQMSMFNELEQAEEDYGWGEKSAPKPGATTLDRIHQAMILFAAGRSEAMKRFLVEEGAGNDPRFWQLAQSFSALYPSGTDEKRWVDGVLARKKGLGF